MAKRHNAYGAAKRNCRLLAESDKSFESIYNIIFAGEGVFAETCGDGGVTAICYGEVRERVEKLAAAIYKRAGKGGFIGLCCENRTEWIELFWAILKSGNKPYLINLNQPQSFTASVLNTLGADFVAALDAENCCGKTPLVYGELLAQAVGGDLPAFGNEVAFSTSGTTLNEKICIYTGKEMAAQVFNSGELIKRNAAFNSSYKGKTKILALLPFYHIFGFEASYLWFAFFNATLVFPKTMAPADMLAAVRLCGVTHIFSVPMFWNAVNKKVKSAVAKQSVATAERFAKYTKRAIKLQNLCPPLGVWVSGKLFGTLRQELFGDSVKFCITGGSFVADEVISAFAALGYPLYNGYGMTEIGIACVDFAPKPKDRLPVSIGKPFPSLQFDISAGGTLLVKGDSVCRKIIINGKQAENAEYFDTGDLVCLDEKGNYRMQGRNSDLVISESGENVNPQFIEELIRLDCAQSFCVTGDAANENVVLVVQMAEDTDDAARERLKAQVDGAIGGLPTVYQIKKVWYTYDSLIEGKDIKVSRSKLRRRMAEGSIRLFSAPVATGTAEEESEIKRTLRGIFAEVLEVAPESINAAGHFLNDLGGTSLDYMALICRIEQQYGITLQLERENFGYSLNDFTKTVEDLTEQ